MERKQKENECRSTHCSSKPSSWDKKIKSYELKWLMDVARRAIAPLLSLPTLTEFANRQHGQSHDT